MGQARKFPFSPFLKRKQYLAARENILFCGGVVLPKKRFKAVKERASERVQARRSLGGMEALDWQQFQTNVSFPPLGPSPQVSPPGSGLRLQETAGRRGQLTNQQPSTSQVTINQ